MATWALRQVVQVAAARGTRPRLMLLCRVGNAASARTIEAAGGVLDPFPPPRSQRVHRYWIDLGTGSRLRQPAPPRAADQAPPPGA